MNLIEPTSLAHCVTPTTDSNFSANEERDIPAATVSVATDRSASTSLWKLRSALRTTMP